MKTTILISCKALIKIVKELQRQLRRRSFGKYTLADILFRTVPRLTFEFG